MSDTGKELEVKFYLSRREELEGKLMASGALLSAPRAHEINLRFDTHDNALMNTGRLLRLRKDTRARLTFKGMGSIQGGARLRQELEFEVSDFGTARRLLEALDFQVTSMYEKYRTTYTLGALDASKLGSLEIVIDEMPYGDFVEIEGPDGESIQKVAEQLGLDWEARILDSYTVLFEYARTSLGLAFTDLSFENFKGLVISPDALGVKIADKAS